MTQSRDYLYREQEQLTLQIPRINDVHHVTDKIKHRSLALIYVYLQESDMPAPRLRELYNSKARQSTAGTRKKGKLKKGSRSEAAEPADCNAVILTTKTKEEKEIERRENLLQEVHSVFKFVPKFYQSYSLQLASQSESKWTSKKKKRLEKYIVRLCSHVVLSSLFYNLYILRTKKSRRRNDL